MVAGARNFFLLHDVGSTPVRLDYFMASPILVEGSSSSRDRKPTNVTFLLKAFGACLWEETELIAVGKPHFPFSDH